MARGRVSAAALALAGFNEDGGLTRPEPPAELTLDEATIWRAVVERMPVDWFPPETFPLLIQYSRMCVRARTLSVWAKEAEKEKDREEYVRITRLEFHVSQVIATLSGKMRLSHSATKRTESTRKPRMVANGKNTWDRE